MWAFLLDPGVQAVAAFGVVGALGLVVFDLYDGSRGSSPVQTFRSRARPSPGVFTAQARPRVVEIAPSVEFWTVGVGKINGRVLRGPCRGMTLDALTPAQFQEQLAYARAHDPQTAPRMEEAVRRAAPAPRTEGEFTRADALAELGLAEGASDAEVQSAYRKLIKRHHPDHGGSHAKAARINQAKNVLS